MFHSHLFPFHTAEFLDHFWEQFIADMDASLVVLELEHVRMLEISIVSQPQQDIVGC